MPQARSTSPLRVAGRAAAVLVGIAFIALLAYGLTTKSADTTIDDALARSEPVAAPAVDLPVLERGAATGALAPALADGRLRLDELRGTPVVLNFWASWCVPCRTEAPVLEAGWRASRNRVAFVGLDMQDLTSDARDFLRELKVTYPTIRDRGNDVARDFGTTGLPETFFIDTRGRVVGHVIGVVSPGQLRAGIAAARAGRPAGVDEGGDRRDTR